MKYLIPSGIIGVGLLVRHLKFKKIKSHWQRFIRFNMVY